MKTLSVLIKPSSSRCNIACKYCFYKDEDRLKKNGCFSMMSLDTLEILVKKAFAAVSELVSFVFQGGEPTLMGLSFFQEFVSFVKKYNEKNIAVSFVLQTNGILLNDEWCEFLHANGFLVGLSYDGDPLRNDANRIYLNGKGTSGDIEKNIELLKQHQVDFNSLLVISHDNAGHAKECYTHLKSLGVQYLQLIPVLDPLDGKHHSYSLDDKDLSRFFVDIFDCWYRDFLHQNEIRITLFENIIYKLLGNPLTTCSMTGACSIECVIEGDGSVYPCDFYVGEGHSIGNIHEKEFKEMIFSRKSMEFLTETFNERKNCLDCVYRGMCIGSCRRYLLNESGVYTEKYCIAFKNFFRNCLPRMIQIRDALKQENMF